MDLALAGSAVFGIAIFVLIEYVDEVLDAIMGSEEPIDAVDEP